ncbi:MAG: hypothetical protein DCC75_09695 [Proteobacteria bacterium]|nr:MAG: hypothetical protein DCC75_09695 [Pseudomonadota bacterium]
MFMDTNVVEVEQALKIDELREAERQQAAQSGALGRFRNLPQVLRTAGTLVILAAAAAFMVQQWSELGHIMRYYYFLGFTAALTLAGLFCGARWREDKGARTFLGIAAAIIPVHFAQLGALIYSRTSEMLTSHGDIPEYFRWVAPDMATALVTGGIGLAALSVVALIAFLALCRSQAGILTAAYIGVNALLLIPSRDPTLMGILAAAIFIGVAYLDVDKFSGNSAMKTKEGALIRVMMCAPVMLLIGRGIFLYPTTELFYSLLLAALTVFLAFFVPNYNIGREAIKSFRALSSFTAAIAWCLAVGELNRLMPIDNSLLIPFGALPYCAFLVLLSFVTPNPQAGYRKFASVLALGSAGLELCYFGGLFPTALLVTISILTLAYGYAEEQKVPFLSGCLGLVFGLLYHIRYAYENYAIDGWVSLAVLGMLTIFTSSFIERNHRELTAGIRNFREKFRSWQ